MVGALLLLGIVIITIVILTVVFITILNYSYTHFYYDLVQEMVWMVKTIIYIYIILGCLTFLTLYPKDFVPSWISGSRQICSARRHRSTWLWSEWPCQVPEKNGENIDLFLVCFTKYITGLKHQNNYITGQYKHKTSNGENSHTKILTNISLVLVVVCFTKYITGSL